jgi:hypothetical protein
VTALPFVPLTLQVQLIYTDDADSDIRNMLYFTYTGSAAATDVATLAGKFKTSWGSNVAPQICETTALEEVFITDLNGANGAQVVDGLASVAGANASSGVTSGAAFIISNLASYHYRGGHSRNYIPGAIVGGLADKNTWTTAYQSAMISAWSAFIKEITSATIGGLGTLAQVVAHRFGKTATAPVSVDGYKLTPLSVPLSDPWTEKVTAYRSNPQVGSQRRRNMQLD